MLTNMVKILPDLLTGRGAMMASESTVVATPRSAVEVAKEGRRLLRGTIGETLSGSADHFGEQDKNLIKFHGTYQQENRDARKNRSREGVGKHYMFMVRCRIPGGKLTTDQYLAIDDLA